MIATRITALLALALVAGCQKTEQSTLDTAAVPAVTEAPGALATRHEAQEALDRARLAFERKDFTVSKSELADAAAFMRTQAQEAAGEAQAALQRAANELDALGDSISKGQVVSVAALDRVSLSVNRAGATFHLQRVKDAVTNRDNTRAGEELTIAVDHLERAGKDAGRQTDAVISAAIAGARTLAGELMKGVGAVPDEMTKVTDDIANAIGRVGAVSVTKEP
jgi:hypothetical protein